jgi:hypothetical protein
VHTSRCLQRYESSPHRKSSWRSILKLSPYIGYKFLHSKWSVCLGYPSIIIRMDYWSLPAHCSLRHSHLICIWLPYEYSLSRKNCKSPDYSVSSNRPSIHNYDLFINHDNGGAASSEKSVVFHQATIWMRVGEMG